MARGQTISITPAATGSPATSFTLFRDGVAVPTQTAKSEATIEARLLVDVDIGAAITVKANNAAGSSAASNVLQYKPGTHANGILGLLGDDLAASGGIASWPDQSSQAQPPTQGTGAAQPTSSTLNGKRAALFDATTPQRLRLAAMTGFGSTTPEFTILIALQWVGAPGTTRQMMTIIDNAIGPGYCLLDSAITTGWPSGYGGGLQALYTSGDSTDGIYWYILRRSNASTNTVKLRSRAIDRVTVTGALAAFSTATPILDLGSFGATLGLNAKVRAFAIFNDDLSDAATLDLDAYAANVLSPSPSWSLAPRVMFVSDSTGFGEQANTGGYRPSTFAAMTAAGLTCTPVGPFTDFGAHRGVSGEVGRDVVLGAATPVTGLIAYLLAHTPDVVVFGHGVNDMIGGSFTGANTIQMRRDLTAICRDTLPLSKVVHLSCVRWTGYAPGAAFLGECDTFNTDMPAAAAAMGCAYIDLGAPARSDFVHPTDPAYAIIGASVMASGIIAVSGG